MTIIKIPYGFYEDHVARDLPAPTPVKETKTHLWIDTHDPNFAELVSDARFYAESPQGWDWESWRIHGNQARALIRAIRKQSDYPA